MTNEVVQIITTKPCDQCDGKGGITRLPGPISYDINEILNQNHKDITPDIVKIKQDLEKIPKEVPGFTDKKVFIACRRCNGSGQIKQAVSLSDLKDLLNK